MYSSELMLEKKPELRMLSVAGHSYDEDKFKQVDYSCKQDKWLQLYVMLHVKRYIFQYDLR